MGSSADGEELEDIEIVIARLKKMMAKAEAEEAAHLAAEQSGQGQIAVDQPSAATPNEPVKIAIKEIVTLPGHGLATRQQPKLDDRPPQDSAGDAQFLAGSVEDHFDFG